MDYFAAQDTPQDDEEGSGMMDQLLQTERAQEYQESLEQRATRVFVPMRLDPYIVGGANVRVMFNTAEMGDGIVHRTYELEIIKGKSRAGGDPLSMLGEVMSKTTPYTGFKYVKILDPIEKSS